MQTSRPRNTLVITAAQKRTPHQPTSPPFDTSGLFRWDVPHTANNGFHCVRYRIEGLSEGYVLSVGVFAGIRLPLPHESRISAHGLDYRGAALYDTHAFAPLACGGKRHGKRRPVNLGALDLPQLIYVVEISDPSRCHVAREHRLQFLSEDRLYGIGHYSDSPIIEREWVLVSNCVWRYAVSRRHVHGDGNGKRSIVGLEKHADSGILIGIAIGYLAAIPFGLVDLSGLSSAGLLQLPRIAPFGIRFEPAPIATFSILFAINSIQAIGDMSATTIGSMDREPSGDELRRGIIAYGAGNMAMALISGLPTASFSQNVGVVTTTKVVNRRTMSIVAFLLILCGIVPVFSAFFTSIFLQLVC